MNEEATTARHEHTLRSDDGVDDNSSTIPYHHHHHHHAASNPTPTPTPTPAAQHTLPFPSSFHPAPRLTTSRYNRQILIPRISLAGQTRISRAKILVVGLGGLGSPAALYLAGAGVHTLGLLDCDVVERSNLHRQILHGEEAVGVASGVGSGLDLDGLGEGGTGAAMTKVASAVRACRGLNGEVRCVPHEVRITAANALDIVAGYDLVLDCTDNPATRYLVSDCCVVLGKTLVSGAAQRLEGQLVVLNWPVCVATATATATAGAGAGAESAGVGVGVGVQGQSVVSDRGPCYRCVFPVPPSPDVVRSCSEIGILGPVVGTVGTLMASEAIRLVVKDGEEQRRPTMLLYNAWPSDAKSMFRVIGLRGRRRDCVVCGQDDVLREKGLERITAESIKEGRMDYQSWCGVPEDVRVLADDERVSAEEFLRRLQNQDQAGFTVVDVREDFEVELGPKIDGSINVPMSEVLQNTNTTVNNGQRKDSIRALVESARTRPVCFVCQQGNDSQIAARKLLDRLAEQKIGGDDHNGKQWVGDVKGGFVALEKFAQSTNIWQ